MKAIITVGISGSGKTTWAEQQEGYLNINLDDIRFNYFCSGVRDWGLYDFKNDPKVVQIRNAKIASAAEFGLDIIVSDTNLKAGRNKNLKQSLEALGYEVEFKFFPISLEEATLRNSLRTPKVNSLVIATQYKLLNTEYPQQC